MTRRGGEDSRADRIAEASDWFARMRGPGADAARTDFEAWRSDPGNARAYDEIAAIWAIAGVATPAPSAAGAARRRQSWLRPALVAAGLAAAFALAFVTIGSGRPDGVAGSAYVGAPEAIRVVRLPDGSRVTLDAASRIRTAFGPRERRVILETGRARFAVAHEAARPFLVLAGRHAIVARGTVFDVRVHGEAVEVTLLEGAVDLEQRDAGAAPRRIVRLAPGQTATFARPDAPVRIEPTGTSSWTAGLLAGRGMRLADVVAEANRHGDARLALAEPALGELRVSGGFRPGDSETLAASLAAALDLTVVPRGDGTLVLARTASGGRGACSNGACPAP